MPRLVSNRALLALVVAVSCASRAQAGPALSYVEQSSGLEAPGLEGGRTAVALADIDADGFVDLLSVGDHGNPLVNSAQHGLMVWFGSSGGAWSLVQTGDLGYGGLAVADVNGDGHLDIGYGVHHNWSDGDFGDQVLEVALGDSTGAQWLAWDDGLATAGETWGMFETDFADVDHDGDLDLGSNAFGCCDGVHVYANAGNGTWNHAWGITGGNSSGNFTFGDVNGDGHADLACGRSGDLVYVGNGLGGFTADGVGTFPSAVLRGIAIGDVTNDGRDDLAVATSGGVRVFTRSPAGSWIEISGALASMGDVKLVQIADMDLDGHADIVALRLGSIEIRRGNGAGTWTPAATIALPACGYGTLRAGVDVDRNGRPDVAVVAEEACVGSNGTNRLRVFVEGTDGAQTSVWPIWPRGGEKLRAGTVSFIRWHAALAEGAGAATVTIELSLAGPGGLFQTIASNVSAVAPFQWTVPATIAPSTNAVLRVAIDGAPAASAITPAAFTIINDNPPTPADLTGDGTVGFADLTILLMSWGPCPLRPASCPADLDSNGEVGFGDLTMLLLSWG